MTLRSPTKPRDLRVLVLTNMYPTPSAPEWGVFVAEQARSLNESVCIRVVAKKSRSAIDYLPFALESAAASLTFHWDLIHAHYGFHSALVPAVMGHRPLVVTFHGSDALIEPSRGRLYARWQRFTVARAQRLIAVSQEVRRRLIDELGAHPGKIIHMPCGADTVRFRPREKAPLRERLGIPVDVKVVLFVGRLSRAKGVDLLQATARELPEAQFYFLGEGGLRWQADNCHFVGPLPHAEIPDWMSAADLFVLPSLSEGTPVAVLEALATETPVVCSRVGACPELIAEGETGMLVAPGDAAGLTAAVRIALFEARFAPARGREMVRKNYDLPVIAQKLIAVYREVLGE
ncbi:MAG: glycosyltransferase [Candidatus Eisenbacteria bacterium]